MTDGLDPRWPRLLAASRTWRATLIPNTSSGIYGPTQELLRAIEAFDEELGQAAAAADALKAAFDEEAGDSGPQPPQLGPDAST